MGDDYWQETAQLFGSLFEKPKMSEKLLTKPPFKYLFDIVVQTTNSTGFAKNLYNKEELSGDYYDTKEKKMYFLRKIITLVGNMLKEEIEAKPNKIVAGVEPDKTNFFLQALYRAAVSGEDSGPHVKKLLAKLAKEEAEAQGGGEEAKQEEAPQEKKKEKPKEEPKPEKAKPAEKPKEEKPSKPKEEPKPEPKAEKPPEKLQRPGTASKRPPPDKSNVQIVDDSQKKTSGTSGIIREDQSRKDEDENLFETKTQETTKKKVSAQGHGQFVQDALKDVQQQEEAEKEEPAQGASKIKMGRVGQKGKKTETSKAAESKAGGVTEDTSGGATSTAGTSQGEVEAIQKLVQALTQNINPLRKSVDFINDDIESMNKEMETWRSQYLNSKAKHQMELMGTEEQLQPLQNKLAELEEQIKDKKFKIQAAKSSILQNEQKIQKLLYSVVSNK